MKELNTKRLNLLVLFILFLAGISNVSAQEQGLTYTQYMDNLTPLNPAYSLLDKAGSVSTLAKKQWVGIPGAPTLFLINLNLPLEDINASAGLTIVNNQFAIENQTEANAYFAKGIQLGQNDFLAVSLNAGVRDYVANYAQLDPNDPQFRNDIRAVKPNIGFGVMYYSDTYYIGISVPELTITSLGTASQQSSINFDNHYYFAGGLLTDLDEDIKFKPAALVAYTKGIPLTADFSGTIILKEQLGIGVDYRTTKQAAGILSINVDDFHIGYSYQFNTASQDLGGINIPTHEVTLSYRFGSGAKNPKLL
jgi:type IX secretion system PorP/SprF family membrane protein